MVKKLGLFLIVSALVFAGLLATPSSTAMAASAECDLVSLISGTYGSGATDGILGAFAAGDTITIKVTLLTATSGAFRIVGNDAGSVTLAGPSSVPGTLTYTVTGSLPVGSIGVGFFIDAADGTVSVEASCTDAPSFSGRGIPAGFVLRTITCDVAVFDGPGGTPVGSNRLKAGQTWFVNPKTVTAADGESWTEVFVSGGVNGWIPTRCAS
jgi:hypothetical protein